MLRYLSNHPGAESPDHLNKVEWVNRRCFNWKMEPFGGDAARHPLQMDYEVSVALFLKKIG